MGLNAFFTFTVCFNMGYTWQEALAIVLLSGILFLIIAVSPLRSQIISSIPAFLKNAISAGIGLFIAFIGLLNVQLISIIGVGADAAAPLGDLEEFVHVSPPLSRSLDGGVRNCPHDMTSPPAGRTRQQGIPFRKSFLKKWETCPFCAELPQPLICGHGQRLRPGRVPGGAGHALQRGRRHRAAGEQALHLRTASGASS